LAVWEHEKRTAKVEKQEPSWPRPNPFLPEKVAPKPAYPSRKTTQKRKAVVLSSPSLSEDEEESKNSSGSNKTEEEDDKL
jgi:hypothetical protein